LGLDPDAARAACAKFDRLPLPAREAFFRLVLEGRSLEEVSAELAASATEVARGARRALDVLLASAPPLPTERPAT
jgi:DNA-directed RNA polymerase specialized sigma24 family protein